MKTTNFPTIPVAIRYSIGLLLVAGLVGCKSGDSSSKEGSASSPSNAPSQGDDSQSDNDEGNDASLFGESQLNYTRCMPIASKLSDGRVLVTGGTSEQIGSSEIYDPSTNTWQLGPNMNSSSRRAARSIRLNDGRILIAGGEYTDLDGRVRPSRDIEVFDPADGQFHIVAQQSLTANGASVTLLPDGKVLILGGSYFDYTNLKQVILKGAELFDPATNTLRPTYAPMTYARTGQTATVMANGQSVLVSGGLGPFGEVLNTEVFYIGWEAFTNTNSMRDKRYGHFSALDSMGRIFAIGGTRLVSGRPNLVNSVEAFMTYQAFDLIPNLTLSSYESSFAQLADKSIVVSGGMTATNGDFLKTLQIFDPTQNSIISKPDMLRERAHHSMTELDDGSLLVVGGENSWGCLQSAERIQLTTSEQEQQ